MLGILPGITPQTSICLKKPIIYYYQVQCQLGLTGLDWCDFVSYIDDNLFFAQELFLIQYFVLQRIYNIRM